MNNSVNNEVIQSLTYSIDNQTILFESFRQEKQEEKDEKLNKFSDLHDSTKLLLLNASSPDGELTPAEPVSSCKEFFNKKNIKRFFRSFLVGVYTTLASTEDIKIGSSFSQ